MFAAMGLIARTINGPGMGAAKWNVENPVMEQTMF
jgi:hypothetical protein